MSSPRVSILMLTFNRPEFISRAIESILTQTMADWELIVVHDGPNETIAGILAAWEAREPRVRYFRRLEKGNIAQATTIAALLEWQRDWKNREHYNSLMGLIKGQGGAYGVGVEYAYTMVHKAPQSAQVPHVVPKTAGH